MPGVNEDLQGDGMNRGGEPGRNVLDGRIGDGHFDGETSGFSRLDGEGDDDGHVGGGQGRGDVKEAQAEGAADGG